MKGYEMPPLIPAAQTFSQRTPNFALFLIFDRTVASDFSSVFNLFSSIGEGGGYDFSNLQLTVDANGLPHFGNGEGAWDISIDPTEVSEVFSPGNGWLASVTYTVTGVPDTSATWFLLGLGLASITVARHFFRQIQV